MNRPKSDGPSDGSGSAGTGAADESTRSLNFIEEIVRRDLASGKHDGRVHTRFPPEPNGYLHIGHAKSICLNFGLAEQHGGLCNLRFDDTNPIKEEEEYVRSIIEDVGWLGYDWADRLYYASDYFERLFEWAELLVRKGKAYVCDLSADEIREHRGTLTQPGRESPFRDRSIEENLDLFRRMGQSQHAGPGDVPHPARHAPSHRRRLVHLPHV
jgi:glutaminyl-tRNA synthetase